MADGGDGTLDVLQAALGGTFRAPEVRDAFGRPRTARWLLLADGSAVVESAAVIPLDPARLDPLAASSRGLGELILSLDAPRRLLVGLGGTATMDAGAGLLEVLDELPVHTIALCDVSTVLYDAPRRFGPQKGATLAQVDELEQRFRRLSRVAPYAQVPGAGAAGGIGAALAALGAELVPGAPFILDQIGFDPLTYELVVTGEGVVDGTTRQGKAPGEVCRRARAAGVRCVMFAGRIDEAVPGAEMHALSGEPVEARRDLVVLGERLGQSVASG